MIPVQELCIGNWVYDGERTQFPMFVRAVEEDYVYLDFPQNEGDLWESKPEDLQGIPLTVEMLTKIGFVYSPTESEETDVYIKKFIFDAERQVIIGYAPRCGSITVRDYQTPKEGINKRLYSDVTEQKYLHELQNFVFMTTKQQLKIEL